MYASKKQRELAKKGVYLEDEYDDLFPYEDVDEIDRFEAQMETRMDFAKAEEARQKKEKANKRVVLAKTREQKKKQVNEDMELSDPSSLDGENEPLYKDSDDNEDSRSMVPFQETKRKKAQQVARPQSVV